ncbi:DUF1499 domain-containing protein [Simiduia sp. 21SJ11W-1]|uniref:DUF1499 domain-containing protein n=1 Tax=Simiduia sp. 21SJ11W-1 TaxID=2909669 RepID=UPI0020A17398|nr:DUF1499 domain-containing protein [Simiduia sp. 21SJ11W-1]UTA46560.1 DUF1499 domain-containing protein [Simiduia sp. 21SJ11W-1]
MAKPWMRWVLVLQIVLLVVMLAGMLANKFELAPFRPAFMTFVYAFKAVMWVTGFAVLASALIWWRNWHTQKTSALYTLALGALPVVVVFVLIGQGLKVPAIHNISTDLENPPSFEAAYALRDDSQNSLDAPAEDVRTQQREFYPELAPLVLAAPADAVFAKALEVVDELGWSLIDSDAAAGRIEAYEETLFFGFKDDVVIRVMTTEAGTVVDVRSVSRVGRSDLGANAKRIKRFLAALKAAV